MTNIGNAYNPDALSAVEYFYGALTARQHAELLNALHDDFVLTLSPGLPLPGAREHHGREAAVANVWGRIPAYDFANWRRCGRSLTPAAGPNRRQATASSSEPCARCPRPKCEHPDVHGITTRSILR